MLLQLVYSTRKRALAPREMTQKPASHEHTHLLKVWMQLLDKASVCAFQWAQGSCRGSRGMAIKIGLFCGLLGNRNGHGRSIQVF
ncbi:MAG: hypothetical protein V4772_25470, partial [Pseudomonadota bacterium]